MNKLTHEEYLQALDDHDCKRSPDDGCETCALITIYEEDFIKDKQALINEENV